MIETNKISEIIDYINNMKFVRNRVVINGISVYEPTPPHPNFTMKGRTPISLINQSDNWHYEKNKLNNIRLNGRKISSQQNYSWEGLPINDGNFLIKKINNYKVIQLRSYHELIDEGKTMHHCVATYANSCFNGLCGIFSVRLFVDDMYFSTEATIEVRKFNVVQIRGKYNKSVSDIVSQVINNWATENQLNIGKYAY